jgi:AcrR family transcriptional regulator
MADSWHQARVAHRHEQAASIATSAFTLITQHGAPALTMAGIAKEADVSRQTLYRYYPDVDAVLVGIAELVASHDEEFEQLVAQEPTPTSQFALIASTVAGAGHGEHSASALAAVLPPEGREVLSQHQARGYRLLSDVLRRGVDEGSFGSDVDPVADAPLILGLLAAADPNEAQRAIFLAHRLVENQTKENTI